MYTYRMFFLTVPPKLQCQKEKRCSTNEDLLYIGISWNRISDWLPIVFYFGTENWEEQLKKHPVCL